MRRLYAMLLVGVLCSQSGQGAIAGSEEGEARLDPKERRLQVGEELAEFHATEHPYRAPETEGGEVVFSRKLNVPGATYVAPHFSKFDLAPGDYVVVRSPDGERSWTYEGRGKMDISPEGFWGIHIAGDTAVIELHSHRGGGYGFEIDKVARGFTNAEMGIESGPESLCGQDDSEEAACYQFSNPSMFSSSKAVARLLISGVYRCTGWLIGCDGQVMTNNHCISTSSEAANTDFEFIAQGATCGTNCASPGACPGVVEATSATLQKTNYSLDYTLLKLPDNPSDEYGYLKITSAEAGIGTDIYIPQHPQGWGKRIAYESSHPQNPDGFGEVDSLTETGCQDASLDEMGYFLDTQGGSSGSPVIRKSDNLVVALHHCRGNFACTSEGGDANRGVRMIDIADDLLNDELLPDCAYDCEAASSLTDSASFSDQFTALYKLRDSVFTESSFGRDLIALHRAHSREAAGLLIRHAHLRDLLREVLTATHPQAVALLEGDRSVPVTARAVDAIEAYVLALSELSDTELGQELTRLWHQADAGRGIGRSAVEVWGTLAQ